MALASTFTPLHQTHLQLSSFTCCNYSASLIALNSHSFSTTSNHVLSYTLEVKALATDTHQELSRNTNNFRNPDENRSGVSPFSGKNPSFGETSFGNDSIKGGNVDGRVIVDDRYEKSRLSPRSTRKMGSGLSSVRSKDENVVKSSQKRKHVYARVDEERKRSFQEDHLNEQEVEKVGKNSRKTKVHDPGMMLRVGLDACSKRGDVVAAIKLYDMAKREGIKMGQYHYAVLLYLCSSAATGFVQPAKSGSGNANRISNPVASSKEIPRELAVEAGADAAYTSEISYKESQNDITNEFLGASDCKSVGEMIELMKSNGKWFISKDAHGDLERGKIRVSEDVKRYALKRGSEIYDCMRSENVPMNEATFTSVARMAMSLGDGELAFDVVKQMKESGIQPRLRSYGPALSAFCNSQNVEKAFIVEQHMLEHGVYPEEPELEALLRVSVEVDRTDRIYYLLHKLRTSVRQVSPSTAELIERWFGSKLASRVGKRKWDHKLVKEAMENGGGGWHGQGWLGKGKWTVSRTSVQSDGKCKFCGEKLATIDLDPTETENFARSVASIAAEREKHSSFQKFQKWLDYYGPFEAVVDAANVGLYNQRKFKPAKVNAVANAIRQTLPAKKWPLIVLHNRRVVGEKMEEPGNKAIIEKWNNADALYATPTGSNDDWYWLYAAIKCRGLIVTNDEMRDHLFQVLGNDFFPKWKERHQVRFDFSETGPILHMPPPCSVVIQESEKGHWHVPIVSDSEAHVERTWLCITRTCQDSSNICEDMLLSHEREKQRKPPAGDKSQADRESISIYKLGDHREAPQQTYKNLRNILSASLLPDTHSILPDLKAAEELSNCIIDFQI